jgi:tetrahydromethanopterin S-methyltransferase subunit E
MIFGSWGIGRVIDLTKSIIAATCFHMIINIMMFNTLLKNGIDGSSKLMILGISVVIWIVILIIWVKEKKTIANNVYNS